MQRNTTWDVMKGIGIFLVVFGHVVHVPWLRTYIWGFHMPLFFFISGVLFNKDKYPDLLSFIKNKCSKILIPYTLFYGITFMYWAFVERHYRGGDLTLLSQFLGLFYGTYDVRFMFFNGALWFLPCLFSIELLYYFISKLEVHPLYQLLLLFGLGGLGLFLSNIAAWLPFGICAACIGLVFYGVGNILRDKIFYYKLNSCWKALFLAVSCVVLQVICLPYTGCDFALLQFKNIWGMVPIAFVGIILCFALASLFRNNYVLRVLGINTLVFFAFQEQTYRAVLFLYSWSSNIPVEILRNNIIHSFIVTIVVFILIFPIANIWNRYVTPIIGRLSK